MPEEPNATPRLRIWQQNVRKSLEAQGDLLGSLCQDFDICAVQEPYIDFRNLSRTNHHWLAFYPTTHRASPKRTWSLFLVNREISSDARTEIPIDSPDVTAIQIQGDFGTIRIFNIYNDCDHNDSITAVANYMRKPEARTCERLPLQYIWLGDFNRHHPLWDEERNYHLFTRRATALAEPLLTLLHRYNMRMVLPKDVPTLRASNGGNLTRVDNVFCSATLADAVVTCDAHPELTPVKADHFPILLTFDISIDRFKPAPRPDFRRTDWGAFREELEGRLDGLCCAEIHLVEEFEERLTRLEAVVGATVASKVPLARPSPYVRCWWNEDLARMKKEMQRLARRAYNRRAWVDDPVHEQHRRARNDYSEAIRRTKAERWMAWLEGLDEESVWTASRLVTGPETDGGRTRVPPLKAAMGGGGAVKEVTTNREKSDVFFQAFFPPRAPGSAVPADAEYPPPAWAFSTITNDQVDRAIRRLKPYKASRPGTTPNSVLLFNRDLLVPHLGPLYRATFSLQYYPARWAKTETLVLRKPGRADYTAANAWCPIVLSDGFARLLNSCLTEDIVTNCERLNILPDNHFGGRPGRTTTDSLHLLTKTIKDAWRRGKVALVLFLDVKGAFPSVAIDMLVHEMRLVGIPEEYVQWLLRRLQGRTTVLSFDDFVSEVFYIIGGLDQGNPFSVIAYILYNSSLLRLLKKLLKALGLLYVDDASLIAIGKTCLETHGVLRDVMERPGGVLEWARDHNCEFAVEKFQLLDAVRKWLLEEGTGRRIPLPRPDLVLGNHVIKSRLSAKFLGVLVDSKLDWKEQVAAAVRKGQEWVRQFIRLSQTTKGVSRQHMRRLYLSIAVPRMLYAADVFLTPKTRRRQPHDDTSDSRSAIKKLASVQRRAALAITGAMRTSPSDTLDVLADLLPFHVLVDKVQTVAALRLASLPETNPLGRAALQAASRFVKRHPTPLHFLMAGLLERRVVPARLERIAAVRQDSKWMAGLEVEVADSREDALEADAKDSGGLKVYSDGSGLGGRVGAAAVLFKEGMKKRRARYLLGTLKRHTVYEGEGVGGVLALHLLRRERRLGLVTICLDNQSVIRALVSNRPRPGHYILDEFHRLLRRLRRRHRNLRVKLRWVPGHEDNTGNEEADKAAKRAAEGDCTAVNKLPRLLRRSPRLFHSRAAARQLCMASIKDRAMRVWQASPRFERVSRMVPDLPSRPFTTAISALPCKHSSLIAQVITGHIPLAKHLHRIRCSDSPICPGCHQQDETLLHYVFHCPVHDNARRVMFATLRQNERNMSYLLSTPATRRLLLNFIATTQRFRSVFGTVPILEDDMIDDLGDGVGD